MSDDDTDKRDMGAKQKVFDIVFRKRLADYDPNGDEGYPSDDVGPSIKPKRNSESMKVMVRLYLGNVSKLGINM